MRLVVRLTPKAAADRIDGWDKDAHDRAVLKVRVRAAPIEGRANTALIALLAKALDMPKSRITLLSGDTSRLKTLEIDGLDEAELSQKLT
ncbi:DUF167 family protein [Asticcacaulis sp. EMRT-3]|uniref:DUF167 family protein n=1 Tax=Asticcacaulis sp. EMRT-3 TaxID=3040349 RepID=UPI0024AF73CB|nr:DUF167 family protein [Asticcacaulis sp. EMRT-3]MDI7775422.1 DUF167 family protein [Asticcacaulis sp. EMRT-3]